MTFVSAPFLIVAARAAFAARGPRPARRRRDARPLARRRASFGSPYRARDTGIRAGMLLTLAARLRRVRGGRRSSRTTPRRCRSTPTTSSAVGGLPTTLAPDRARLRRSRWWPCRSVGCRLPRATRTPSTATASPPTERATEPVRFSVDHRLGSFHLAVASTSNARHLGVLGPSGSGKSALLRCLAGLYGPGPGPVFYGDQLVSDVPVEKRGVGYVAQGFSLYPHLTVWRHLLFAKGSSPELAAYWLEHLRLSGLEGRTARGALRWPTPTRRAGAGALCVAAGATTR